MIIRLMVVKPMVKLTFATKLNVSTSEEINRLLHAVLAKVYMHELNTAQSKISQSSIDKIRASWDIIIQIPYGSFFRLLSLNRKVVTTMTTNNQIPNRLANEKSPYLLQHANNPVNWFPWGDEAFQIAKAENKPVFLSIGYS